MMRTYNLVLLKKIKSTEGLQTFRAKCEEQGVAVNGIRACESKQELLRYLDSNGIGVNGLILFDDIGPDPLSVSDIGEFRKRAARDAVIVSVFYNESCGGTFARTLLHNGIFNALLLGGTGKVSMADIGQRLLSPGTWDSAREYYRVDDDGDEGFEASSRKSMIDRSIDYIMQYGGTQEELLERISNVRDSEPEIVEEAISHLPDGTLRQLLGVPGYDAVAKGVLRGRNREEAKPQEDAGRKTHGRLPFGQKGDRDILSGLRAGKGDDGTTVHAGPTEVAFLSTNIGVGCTYNALMCAYSIAGKGKKTAVVELDHYDRNFSCLCSTVKGTRDTGACRTFDFGNVTFFYETKLGEFRNTLKDRFECVIYDYGCCSREIISDIALFCDRVFAVTSEALYKRDEFEDFLDDIQEIDTGKRFICLFSGTDEKGVNDIRAAYPDRSIEPVPYCRNPFCPSRAVKKLMCRLVTEGAAERKPARHSGKDVTYKLRENSDESPMPVLITAAAALAVSIVALSLCISNQNRRYDELYESAREYAVTQQKTVAGLNDEIARAEEREASYERTVVMFTGQVPKGTRITAGMIEERTIRSDLPSDLYVTPEEIIGKYAACNIEPGVPVYGYHVAQMAEKPLPAEVESPTKAPAPTKETAGTDGEDEGKTTETKEVDGE